MRVLDAGLVTVFVLATAIWVGGLVTIAVIAQVAHRTLTPAGHVAFFRRLDRIHGIVGSTALLMALLTGSVLLRHHPADEVLTATAVVAIALLAASGTGIVQARRMTVLRHAMIDRAGDAQLLTRVHRGARSALPCSPGWCCGCSATG